MSIEMLNVRTLARIFSHLDTIEEKLKMESVCKKWQMACRESIAWKNIKGLDLIRGKYTLPKFSNRARVNEFFNRLFDKFGTHLTRLSFFCGRWTILYLSQIQHRCPNLTHLEIKFGEVPEFNKSHLTFLRLSCIHELIDDKLFTGLKKLKSLTVDNYVFPKDATILESLNDDIEVISLTASSFRTLTNSKNLADKIGRWHSLKELTLGFWKISNSLWNLLTTKKSLTYLALYSCDISKSQILNVTKLKNLQVLFLTNVGGVHDQLLYKITNELKDLMQLNLSLCREFSTNALRKIGDLKKLNFLSLMRLDNVDDSVVMRIINNCKMLMGLNLSGCKNLSKTTLHKLGQLKELVLFFCDWMNQVDDEIFDHIKNLRHLECEGCKNLGDAGLEKVLKSSPNLDILNVARTAVTVETLRKFCDAKANSDGRIFYIKANASLMIEYLGDKEDPPEGIFFMDPGPDHPHHECCQWNSDNEWTTEDEWTTDDDDDEDDMPMMKITRGKRNKITVSIIYLH